MRRVAGTSSAVPYAAWLVQPAYVFCEVVLAVLTGVHYSLRDDTISALGSSCATASSVGCSSSPGIMNTTFIVFGALQVLGAVGLLARGGRRPRLVAALWIVAGIASIGVGLAPVDAHPRAHTVVALVVFATQPLAVLLHARQLSGPPRTLGTILGIGALVGAVAFGVVLGQSEWSGALERLAIWPAKLWLPLAAVVAMRRLRSPHERPPGRRPADTARGTRPTE